MSTMGFRLLKGKPNIVHLPEDETSGSFSAGDLVVLSSGEVIVASTSTDVYGVALKGYSGTAGTSIPVSVITPEQVWVAEADTTTATSMVGGPYKLNLTAGSQSIDLGSAGSAGAGVTIEAIDPRDGATTGSGGRVWVRFNYGAVDAMGG